MVNPGISDELAGRADERSGKTWRPYLMRT
jgi:hypothetical protein